MRPGAGQAVPAAGQVRATVLLLMILWKRDWEVVVLGAEVAAMAWMVSTDRCDLEIISVIDEDIDHTIRVNAMKMSAVV